MKILMRLASARKYYGFVKPYDFHVVIPLLLHALILTVVLLAFAYMLSTDSVHAGSQRYFFLCYIAALLFAGVLSSKIPSITYPILIWCMLDLAMALSSSLPTAGGTRAALLPEDMPSFTPDYRFIYHPLLQGVPRPKFASASGTRVTHNSLGVRGAELQNGDLQKEMIFVYGGSTAYDIAVPQGATWPERLQAELADKYLVVNFGVPGYSTTEHIIQTAFYQRIASKRPTCAVYYVGWNDIRNAHIPSLDDAYADFHLRSQIDSLLVRKSEIAGARYSPLLRLLSALLKRRFDTVPVPPDLQLSDPVSGNDEHLEGVFKDHIQVLVALNSSRKVKSIFVGQMLNRSALTSEGRYGWLPRVRDKDVWDLQLRFNQVLKSSAESLGAAYVDAGIENFTTDDFADNGHFLAAGSKKFARLIAKDVARYCGAE